MTIGEYLESLLAECERCQEICVFMSGEEFNTGTFSSDRDESEEEFWLVVSRISLANDYADDGNIKACREVMRELRSIIGTTEE